VFLQVPRDQQFHRGPIARTEVSAIDEMIDDGPRLLMGPRLKGSDELPLVDQAILEREHPKQEVSR
jgi:hypothetical protein